MWNSKIVEWLQALFRASKTVTPPSMVDTRRFSRLVASSSDSTDTNAAVDTMTASWRELAYGQLDVASQMMVHWSLVFGQCDRGNALDRNRLKHRS